MAREHTSAFDASIVPQLADLVEEVRRTRTRKPIQLRPDGETVAYLDPASPEPKTSKTSSRRRGAGLIGEPDLLIAATAIHLGCTLVTRNRRHFERIDGLQLYQ